jgi:energy-coupling factor transporter ATP-binding protein EcfA2
MSAGHGEILTVEDFSFTYTDQDVPALSDVSFSIRKGEIVALAGASGSGKTTLLRSLNGIIPHMFPGDYSGKVIVGGLDARETPVCEMSRQVGFLFQNPENQIFKFTVEGDVAFGLESMGVERSEIVRRVNSAITLLHLESLRKRSPNELSEGQKQRVAIAGVLVMGPQLLVLDEPTSMLDPTMATEVVSLVVELNRRLGLTVLLVEHRLELIAPILDEIVVLAGGRVWMQGTPEEVLGSEVIRDAGLSLPPVVDIQRQMRASGRWPHAMEFSVDGFCAAVREHASR